MTQNNSYLLLYWYPSGQCGSGHGRLPQLFSSSNPVPEQETSWLPMLAVPGTQVLSLDLLPGPPHVNVHVVHADQQLQSALSTVPAEI